MAWLGAVMVYLSLRVEKVEPWGREKVRSFVLGSTKTSAAIGVVIIAITVVIALIYFSPWTGIMG
jgi:hypothetical protein